MVMLCGWEGNQNNGILSPGLFHGNFEIFQDPFFEIFPEIFNIHYKVT